MQPEHRGEMAKQQVIDQEEDRVLARELVRSPQVNRKEQGKSDHLLAVVKDAVELAVDEGSGRELGDQKEIERPLSCSLVSAVTPWALIKIRLRIARPITIRASDEPSGLAIPSPRKMKKPAPSAKRSR